ncbi:hypothetical protein ACH4E8_20290 [Streptomyces sp. NPDC017979]|uniref:hypothetical protein n=1 Tax=Streptomyces sp. NPDC017979 TaxID=3365024 RepID=UPI0037A93B28
MPPGRIAPCSPGASPSPWDFESVESVTIFDTTEIDVRTYRKQETTGVPDAVAVDG